MDFFVANFPSAKALVVGGPVALLWSSACLMLAGFLKTRRHWRTGHTRKVFHFLIFGSVVVVHRVWGTPGVCLFGGMTTLSGASAFSIGLFSVKYLYSGGCIPPGKVLALMPLS